METDFFKKNYTSETGSGPEKSSTPDIDEDDIREEVARDIRNMNVSPAHAILISMGILEDMEVCRRVVMRSSSNKTIYLYANKLSVLKQYASIFKDSVAVTKTAKVSIDAEDSSGADGNFDGAEITIRRE